VHSLVLGLHCYFAWYEPVVAGLSAAGLVAFVVAGRRLRLAAPQPRALGATTFAVLFVQESLEQHRLVSLTPSQLLLLLAAVALVSWLVAAALRVVRGAFVVAAPAVFGDSPAGWTVHRPALRRLRPLARSGALRAPPPLAAS
jgi:hypothetical protein